MFEVNWTSSSADKALFVPKFWNALLWGMQSAFNLFTSGKGVKEFKFNCDFAGDPVKIRLQKQFIHCAS